MTEEEAKTKWCPMAKGGRAVSADEFAVLIEAAHKVRNAAGNHCIGSACMAWRWHDPNNLLHDARKQEGGYCGLAGHSGWRP